MAEIQQEYSLSYNQGTNNYRSSPSTSHVMALALLLPLSGFLLFISAITFTGTLIGIALTVPLFVIFSPVLVPAALLVGLVVTGFLTAATFGVTSVASFAWIANYVRHTRWSEQLEYAKNRAQDTISHAAQSVKEAGEGVMNKVQEAGQEVQDKAQNQKARNYTAHTAQSEKA